MKLNPQQNSIIDLPITESALVMAGAGSGKTTVIAHRALSILESLTDEKHLQMLTFSNKAAKEMKERVKRISRGGLERIRFDTFHSFCIKLLKDDPGGYHLPPDFSLLNESDIKRSIRANAKASGLPSAADMAPEDRKRLNPLAWLNTWSLARQAGYDVSNSANKSALCERIERAHGLSAEEVDIAWNALTGYELEKRKSQSVDFDDLLYFPLKRIAVDAEYCKSVRDGLGYVVVDEAQDTNRIQYELVKRIALGHCGVTCVGDDDQSIYGWRGAEVSNLRRFLSNFRAVELRLEQNYRSTKLIVSAAASLIRHNNNRLEKNPFSEGEQGVAPALRVHDHSRAMADEIAREISSRVSSGRKPKDIAILYRTNRMALLLEQSLRRVQIPYHVVGGMSLFDRGEVVAVTAAMRAARNPRDIHALKSLVPYIDGFGMASANILAEWIDEHEHASLKALPDALQGVRNSKLSVFRDFYEELTMEAHSCDSAAEFVRWAIEGPMGILDREKDDQLRERKAQHLQSLGNDIAGELMERRPSEPKLTWRDVMMEVALRDARQTEAEDGCVTLSTVHRAKGLEWGCVFVAGMSEGIMPLDARMEVSEDDAGYCHMEEERRLAYVAATRAKQELHFHHSEKYDFPGSREDKTYQPSRFISELGLSMAKSKRLGSQEAEVFDDAGEGFDVESFRRSFMTPRGM